MIERHVERFAMIFVALVALLTGGAWLAAHGGPPQYPQPPFQQQPPQPPPQQIPPEPPPKSSACADCASCADCMSGCDVSDCDVSGCDCDCSGVDCSGVDCTLARASTRTSGFLVLLLPLALLDAWRRGLLRRA